MKFKDPLMTIPSHIDVEIFNGHYSIELFHTNNALYTIENQGINIFASGPSVTKIEFNDDLLNNPSMFVNGSLALTGEYEFLNVVGYIISDERFIRNNPEILKQYYIGQPLYITSNVLVAIVHQLPEIIDKYHQSMRVIFPTDRPIEIDKEKSNILVFFKKLINKKMSLRDFKNNKNFIIETPNNSLPIGVSLDVSKGFIEAGTVAYIAAQLAFTLGASEINLYGIDLINSNQPRFYENKKDMAPCKLDKAVADRIVPSFDLLASEYAKRGVTVTNYSPVSRDLFKTLKKPLK